MPEADRTPTSRWSAVLGCLLLFLGVATPGWAWEPDVHYGLTWWLAIQAGIAPPHARWIALGDEDMDEGTYLPATWAGGLHILVSGDERAARSIRLAHFPSDGDVPAAPAQREVFKGSKIALDEVERRLRVGPDQTLSLRQFGMALHALQDSWSHQGVPQVPFSPCKELRPTLGWGHPAQRGGWTSHDADLTPVAGHVPEVIEMAQVVLDLLRKFAAANPGLTATVPAQPVAFDAFVKGFAEAKSRPEKLRWLEAAVKEPQALAEARGFLASGSSLPGDITPLASPPPIQPQPPSLQGPIPPGALETITGFLGEWIVRKRIGDAVQRVALESIAETCGALQAFDQGRAGDWLARALTSWLLKDHGRVNAAGHADPSDPRYRDLPSDPRQAGDQWEVNEYPSLDQALVGPDGGGPIFSFVTGNEGSSVPSGVAAMFRFRDKPRDDLLVIAAPNAQNQWRIVQFVWSTR